MAGMQKAGLGRGVFLMLRRNDFTRLGFRGALVGSVQLPMIVSKLICADFFYLFLLGKSTPVQPSGLPAPVVSYRTRTQHFKMQKSVAL